MTGQIIVRGYHGTTRQRVASILKDGFEPSTSEHSWLGQGRYFFQDAPIHAYNWARNLLKRASRRGEGEPVVLSVDLDISQCMDLTDGLHWLLLRDIVRLTGTGSRSQLSPLALYLDGAFIDKKQIGFNYEDFVLMEAAIETLRQNRASQGLGLTAVRAAFIEGSPVHPNSWLFTQSCVAVSVIDPAAIVNAPVEVDMASILGTKGS
ncbi:hypothetical protein [Methylobacterium brachiatum]|uniref:hypothetical protein n=1 Tax=Methylobacterium brachiatum TaxID=269660 RepID=UPI002446EA69|nr:hypothetical protein [Methylobacterium brachiatum]MDH2313892.1 hypothetical protein [Methylobacterium brachiatum]